MPSDGKGQGLEDVSGPKSGPNPDPDAAPQPDPPAGSETDHVIDVVVEEKISIAAAEAAKPSCLSRSDSGHEQCRICQQPTEEPLIVLGCRCRGELSIVHQSCIEIWFRTKGSNKCEICKQVAANVPSLDFQPSTNYRVWRVNSAYRGTIGRGNRARCCSPLLAAFAILIGGLLLFLLITASLGVSELSANIVIGVLVVFGLGTAFRLALVCFHKWGSTRNTESIEVNIHHASRPAAL